MDKVVVLLDSGHGINCPGKRSPNGELKEWEYTKKLALAIADELRSEDINVVLIKPEDEDVPLAERVKRVNEIARTNKAILISIHLNAAGDGLQWKSASGWECYTCKGQTESDVLAECLCNAAREKLKDKQLRTDDSDGDSDKEAGFYLLKHTKCPAVLTENLFMDSKTDYEYLLSDKGFNSIVDLHVLGIIKYLNKHE
jgi:N-acetylmuramoyl-L-alanine amidase